MSTELIKHEELQTMQTLATTFVKSGLFQDTKSVDQAMVKLFFGHAMGLSPAEAMTGIHIIQGKVALSSGLISARIKASRKYDYRVISLTDTGCELQFYQDGKPLEPISSFQAKDAKAAGLLGRDMYAKYPRNMYFARALTNGARWFCAEVFGGPIYTPDELRSAGHIDVEAIEIPSTNGHITAALTNDEAFDADQAAGRAVALEMQKDLWETSGDYKIEFGSKKGQLLSKCTNISWLENHINRYRPDLSEIALMAMGQKLKQLRAEFAMKKHDEELAAQSIQDAEIVPPYDEMNQGGTYPTVEAPSDPDMSVGDYVIEGAGSPWNGAKLKALTGEMSKKEITALARNGIGLTDGDRDMIAMFAHKL